MAKVKVNYRDSFFVPSYTLQMYMLGSVRDAVVCGGAGAMF